MRAVLLTVVVVVFSAYLVGFGTVAVFVAPPATFRSPDLLLVALVTTGLTVSAIPSLFLGSTASVFDFAASAESRRRLLRWRLIATVCVVVGIAAVVAGSILVHLPVWYPVVASVVAIVLGVVAGPLGDAIRRRSRQPEWEPLAPRFLATTVRVAAIVFGATALLAAVGVVLLVAAFGPMRSAGAGLILQALSLPFLGLTGVFIVRTFQLNKRVRGLIGTDVERARRIGRAVLRRKGELRPGEEVAAARYASVAGLVLGIQTATSISLGAALILQAVGRLSNDRLFPVLQIVIIVVFAIVIPYTVILAIVRVRNARSFAREHPVPSDDTSMTTADEPTT